MSLGVLVKLFFCALIGYSMYRAKAMKSDHI
jgi:tellurite resistance protein TehA-like permease